MRDSIYQGTPRTIHKRVNTLLRVRISRAANTISEEIGSAFTDNKINSDSEPSVIIQSRRFHLKAEKSV